jgi:transposase
MGVGDREKASLRFFEHRKWKPCFSKRLYQERNLIGPFFFELKHFRSVATRYDARSQILCHDPAGFNAAVPPHL